MDEYDVEIGSFRQNIKKLNLEQMEKIFRELFDLNDYNTPVKRKHNNIEYTQ